MTKRDLFSDFQRLVKEVSPDARDPSLELVLGQMEPLSSRLLRMCAIPHQFNQEILQILDPKLSSRKAEQLYSEFASLSFVDNSDGGLAIHDATRRDLFNSWLAPQRQNEFARLNEQLCIFYKEQSKTALGDTLDSAHAASMFHQIGTQQDAGFAEFERLFQQARHQFNLSKCESLIKLVHEFDSILKPAHVLSLLYHEGKLAADLRQWKKAAALFEEVVQKSDDLPELHVKALNRLGMVHEAKREWSAAADVYHKALEVISAGQQFPRLRARVLHNLAITHRERDELNEADKLLKESIELLKEENNLAELANAYNSQGTLYRKLGDTALSIKAYENALSCLDQSGEIFRKAQLYNNIGAVYADMSDWQQSVEYMEKSLEIKKEAGDSLGQAMTLNNLGRVYQNLDMKDRAVETAMRAIKLFSKMREKYKLAAAKRNLAKLYHALGEDELSIKNFQEAIDMFDRLQESAIADATRAELEGLSKKTGLPWWAWTCIVIIVLLVVIGLIAIIAQI